MQLALQQLRRGRDVALLALASLAVAACAAESPIQFGTHVDDWRDEVIYQVVVDRFDNGDPTNDTVDGIGPIPGDLTRYQGGDWTGLTRRLDYISGLGATAIWISPIVRNVARTEHGDGFHGYWAADYTELEPRFGTLQELQTLVSAAHQRNLKVLIDIVPNHTGRVFYYDLDGDSTLDEGELEPPFAESSAYDAPITWLTEPPRVFRDGGIAQLSAAHFHRRGQTDDHYDVTQRQLGDFFTGLRDLNTEDPEVVAALVDTWVYWIMETDVDGARIDAIPHAPEAFWNHLTHQLRQRLADEGKHNFLLAGELFDSDPELLSRYTANGGLDTVFDFALKWELIDAVILGGAPPATAVPALMDHREHFPTAPQPQGIGVAPWSARIAFADNHDLSRVRGLLDDPFAVELALAVIFTVDGIPSVYYGTEQNFAGSYPIGSREVMWHNGFSEQTRLYRYIARLSELRRDSAALRRGDLTVRYADEAGPGLLVWERSYGSDHAIVAINSDPTGPRAAVVPTGWPAGTRVRDLLAGGLPVEIRSDGSLRAHAPPRGAAIYIAQ